MPSSVVKKLSYYGLYGRVSALHFQLAHAGVEFEIEAIETKDWPALKPTKKDMPFATLESGESIVEAQPISRMIAVE